MTFEENHIISKLNAYLSGYLFISVNKEAMALALKVDLEGNAYYNFINSLQSDVTKEGYKRALVRFMQYFQIKDTETLAKLTRQDLESYLIRYFQHQKENNKSKSAMELTMFAVQHFCVMNDILINFKKISKFKRSTKIPQTDLAYTHSDILQLTSVMPLRIKTCVMIFASTGIRRGAITLSRLESSLSPPESFYFYHLAVEQIEKLQLWLLLKYRQPQLLRVSKSLFSFPIACYEMLCKCCIIVI